MLFKSLMQTIENGKSDMKDFAQNSWLPWLQTVNSSKNEIESMCSVTG